MLIFLALVVLFAEVLGTSIQGIAVLLRVATGFRAFVTLIGVFGCVVFVPPLITEPLPAA